MSFTTSITCSRSDTSAATTNLSSRPRRKRQRLSDCGVPVCDRDTSSHDPHNLWYLRDTLFELLRLMIQSYYRMQYRVTHRATIQSM